MGLAEKKNIPPAQHTRQATADAEPSRNLDPLFAGPCLRDAPCVFYAVKKFPKK